MKKLISLLAAVVILSCTMCGCTADDVKDWFYELAGREKIVFTTPEEFEAGGRTGYSYNKLTEEEKYAYIAIYEGIENHSSEIPVVHIPMDEIEEAMNALYADRPEITCVESQYTYVDWSDISVVQLEYTCTLEECRGRRERLEQAIDEIVASVPEGSDEYQTELYLHDYLVSHVSYDFEAYENYDANPDAYSAYGALLDGKAVCGGYTGAYQLLLQEAGIQNYAVYGSGIDRDGKTEKHVWNVVTIDGEDYHVDTTYDDYLYEFEGDYTGHLYFNVTTDEILEDHIIDEGQEVDCTASSQNFFVKNDLIFESYDNDCKAAISEEIAENLKNGVYISEFKFSPQSYSGAVADLTGNSGIFHLVDEAQTLSGIQIDEAEIYYITEENMGYFCVILCPVSQ